MFKPIFSRVIKIVEPQGTIYKGSQGFLTNIGQVTRSFLQDLRGRQQICSKKGYFPREKIVLLYLVLLSMADLRQHFSQLDKVPWQ